LILVEARNGTSLSISPRDARTIGDVIISTDSKKLIAGVKIQALQVFADDRGFFMELARLGAGIAEGMLPDQETKIQISATSTYPGTIKAIHYHFEQTDLWMPISGMFQVFLYDLRAESSTFGHINTIYVGDCRPWILLIPPGVAHGYKVLGTKSATLIYATNRYYNPADEGRIAYNDSSIAYDWEVQHK
jgi:dTDP-4-dehydrorhamnose 3,5-epimerase